MYKNHLLKGVSKGAFSQEEAEKRFSSWMVGKESKVQAKKDALLDTKQADLKGRLAQELKVQEEKRNKLEAKRAKKLAATIEAIQESKEEASTTESSAEAEPQA